MPHCSLATSPLLKSSVVDKILCVHCLACYAGLTSQRLGQWLEEHERIMADFSIANHAWTKDHPVELSVVTVCDVLQTCTPGRPKKPY